MKEYKVYELIFIKAGRKRTTEKKEINRAKTLHRAKQIAGTGSTRIIVKYINGEERKMYRRIYPDYKWKRVA